MAEPVIEKGVSEIVQRSVVTAVSASKVAAKKRNHSLYDRRPNKIAKDNPRGVSEPNSALSSKGQGTYVSRQPNTTTANAGKPKLLPQTGHESVRATGRV